MLWLCEIEKAIKEVKELCPLLTFTEVRIESWGIRFYTLSSIEICWFNNGNIMQIEENGAEKLFEKIFINPLTNQ